MSDYLPTEQNNLVLQNLSDVLSDLSEVELDNILNNDFVKDIPVISTAAHICKAVHGIRERSYIKKLEKFINAMQQGIASSEQADYYKKRISDNPKSRNKEVEYLLIIIDRFIDEHKPEFIAKLYLAFLDERLTWEELTVSAEIIDRLLPGDYELLKKSQTFTVTNNQGTENALRLVALGLAYQTNVVKPTISSFMWVLKRI